MTDFKMEMRDAFGLALVASTSSHASVTFDFGRSSDAARVVELDLGRIEASYDQAVARAHEMAWETFVAEVAASAGDYSTVEASWLIGRLLRDDQMPLRRTLALVRAAGQLAERRKDLGDLFAGAFQELVRHDSPDVRAATIEAASEGDIAMAKSLAAAVVDDPSPHVREVVGVVLQMTE